MAERAAGRATECRQSDSMDAHAVANRGGEPMSTAPGLNRSDPELAVRPVLAPTGFLRRAGTFFVHEFLDILPPTIFFAIGFNLILLTTNLLLADYGARFSSFLLATAGALVVGKAVLVANAMPAIRRYDRAPLIRPILFKTTFYWAIVFIARLLEHWIKFSLAEHRWFGAFLPHEIATFSWHRFVAIQLWIFVLFLIYVTASEFNRLFGHGELARIMLTYRPSQLQLNRRERIRELARLSRLADAHSADEFRNPASSAHAQLVEIVRRLARDARAHAS
jgi:hypothetical protein